MRRIDSRTVELTSQEVVVKDLFEERLDLGMGIQEAARSALETYLSVYPASFRYITHKEKHPVGVAFVHYLSDGTLRWDPIRKVLLDRKV